MIMRLMKGIVAVSNWPAEVRGERPYAAAYVKLLTPNSVIDQELRDRGRAGTTNPDWRGSVLVSPFIKKFGLDKK